MKSRPHSESGNILFLILVAVALFAALSLAVSSSNRIGGGQESTSSEAALIDSSEIVQYGSALENAVTFMRVSKRCTATDISFEGPPFDGSDADYINPSAPLDFSCHIFHPQGGKVARVQAPKGVNDGRDWAYIEARVLEIGADQTACPPACNELILVLGGIKDLVCQKINLKITGSSTIPVQDDGNTYEDKKYVGNFTAGADIDQGAAGQPSMCIEDSNGVNYYYHVLMPR